MTYLVDSWGGNDNAGTTWGTFDIYSNTSGQYPAARTTAAGTYPVYITNVGAYMSATGSSSADGVTGYYILGTVTTNGFTGGVSNTGSTYVNAGLKYDGVTGGALVYSGASAVLKKFTWVNTSTWGVWAGRNTDAAYTTVYGTTSRAGRMGGAVTYYLAPSVPTAVTATSSTTVAGRITVSWTVPAEDGGSGTNRTASSEINAYSIYRSTSVNGTYSLVSKTTSAVTSPYTSGTFIDDTAKSTADTYYYKVAAHNLVTDKIGSTTTGQLSAASVGVSPPAAPNTPVISSATKSTTVSGSITVSWTGSVTAGSPAQKYYVYRNSTLIASDVSSPYTDTGLQRGTTNTYIIRAINGIGLTDSAPVSEMAPGVPSAPQSTSLSAKVGRNVTMAYENIPSGGDYGNSVTEYRMQLSIDNGASWRGWNSTTKEFTSSNTYNVVTSGSFQYLLLTPALTYLFRVYAVNSIGDGDKVTTATGLFVSAGGRRLRGSAESDPGTFQPTETAKRFAQTSDPGVSPVTYAWIDLTVAKKYDPTNPSAVNGWVDLS